MFFSINMLKRYLGAVFIGALIMGVLVQPIAVFFHHLITSAVMLLIGLSVLSLDIKKLAVECNNYVYHVLLLLMNLIILPVVIYFLIVWLASFEPLVLNSFAIGSILINCVPVAAAVPATVFVLQGNFERASLNMLLSYVFVSITLPLVFFLLGINLHVSILYILSYTASTVLPPIVVSILIKKFFSSYIAYVYPYISPISITLLVVIILGCPVGIDHIIFDHWEHALVAISISMISYMFLGIVGWFFAKPAVRDRLTSCILLYSSSIGLSVVFVHAWFKEDLMTIFYVSLSVVSWCIMMPIVSFWVKYARKRELRDLSKS